MHVLTRILAAVAVAAGSVKELIALARANPGALTFGSSDNGGVNHLSGELFKSLAGVDMVHVPYKGAAPAAGDLLGGRLSMVFDSIVVWSDHIKTGRVRALGVSSLAPTYSTPEAFADIIRQDIAKWAAVVKATGARID